MSGPQTVDNGSNGGVQRVSAPNITIVFDPVLFRVQVSGNAPNLEFAKAMVHMALDEVNVQIRKRDARDALAVAGPDFLDSLKGVRG